MKHLLLLTSLVLLTILSSPLSGVSQVSPQEEIKSLNIGACTHNSGYTFDLIHLLEKMGAKIVRDEWGWQWAEQSNGNFYLDERLLKYINDLTNKNIKLVLILDYSNILYAPASSDPPYDKYGPDTPELRKAFCRYVSFLVSALKGKVYAWEIWNEPDLDTFWQPSPNLDNYWLLVKEVASLIRSIDPQALIVAGAFAFPNLRYFDNLDPETLNKLDVISFHWYCSPNSPVDGTGLSDLENVEAFVKAIRQMGKRAWITEIGYPTSTNPYGVSEETQANYLKSQLILAQQLGVETCIIYDLIDDGPNPCECEHRFGLFHQNLTPKPAAIMLGRLNSVPNIGGIVNIIYDLLLNDEPKSLRP